MLSKSLKLITLLFIGLALIGASRPSEALLLRVSAIGGLLAPDNTLFTINSDSRITRTATLNSITGFLDFGGGPGRFSGSTLRNIRLLSRTSAVVEIEGRWNSPTTPRNGTVAVMSIMVEQFRRGRVSVSIRDKSNGRMLYTFGRNADGSPRMGTMSTGGAVVYYVP